MWQNAATTLWVSNLSNKLNKQKKFFFDLWLSKDDLDALVSGPG